MPRAAVAASPEELVQRAAVLALLARLLGRDPSWLLDGHSLDDLRGGLVALDDARALSALATLDPPRRSDREALERGWVRWFDQGRVPPYECSNTVMSAGGHTAPLADIAGFYRAFGMRARGDRPDHVVAELEFAAHVTLAEALARTEGRDDDAGIAADAARTFLRDHLGRWLDAWAARVTGIDPPVVWAPLAAVAAAVVGSEARRRNVVIVHTERAFLLDDDLPDDAPDLECG